MNPLRLRKPLLYASIALLGLLAVPAPAAAGPHAWLFGNAMVCVTYDDVPAHNNYDMSACVLTNKAGSSSRFCVLQWIDNDAGSPGPFGLATCQGEAQGTLRYINRITLL